MKLTRPLLFASALALAMGVQAQGMGNSAAGTGTGSSSSSSSASTTNPGETMSDKDFATQAAQAAQAEIQLGKLAEKKASDPAVKDYAKQLVKDHTSNSKQLEKVAKSEKIKLPKKKLSSDDKATYDELSKLSGPQFDQRFIQTQVQDHQKDIDLYQKEANESRQGAMENYARSTLPHLQMHLDTANRLASQVGASSSGSAGSSAAGGASSGNMGGAGSPSGSGNTGSGSNSGY